MNFKKLFIGNILIILLVCMCLSTVCAADNGTDVYDNAIITDSVGDNVIIGDTITGNSFADLQKEIDNTEVNGTLNLDKDYTWSSSDSKNPITIGKSITINGNGHSIDAQKQTGIFRVTGSNVKLLNLTFINGNSYQGGAIYSNGGVFVSNSKFINNKASEGSAVYGSYRGANIVNSVFYNNTGSKGTVFLNGGNSSIVNCSFNKNNLTGSGAAIYSNYYSSYKGTTIIKDSNFTDNCINSKSAYQSYGGAIYGKNPLEIYNSNFVNNSCTGHYGGAIFYEGPKLIIEGSSFIRNKAQNYGGAICVIENTTILSVNNSLFEDNFAQFGGAISSPISFVNNSKFINNRAFTTGGAIVGLNVTADNSIFENNSARTGSDIGYFINFSSNNNTLDSNGTYDFNATFMDADQFWYICAELIPGMEYYLPITNDLNMFCNRLTGEYVGEYLKILIYFNIGRIDPFYLSDDVYAFTDKDYLNSDRPRVIQAIEAYNNGFRVPDSGARFQFNDALDVILDFYGGFSHKYQNYFMVNVTLIERLNPNLTVDKIALDKTILLGNQTRFTVVVKNIGDCVLNGVYVVEDIPDGLIFDKFTGDKWIKVGNKFIYNSTLMVNQSVNFTITFNTTKTGNFTNVVVAGADNADNKTANNTTAVYSPSLDVIKLANTPVIYLGNQTSFTVVVRNTGDCSLDNVYVIENIPEGLVYAGFTGDKWVKNGNKFVYTGSLAAGKSANFTIFFNTAKSGNFTNVVVAGADHVSNKTANNTTEVIENSPVPGNDTDNSTDVPDNSTAVNQNTDINKSADVKNAAGNPILVLLMVLAILGLRPLKGKK